MSLNRAKMAYLTYDDMFIKLTSGQLNSYDTIYTKDTHEIFIVSPEGIPTPMQSKILIFESISDAERELNKNINTYVGQIVSILTEDKFVGYIVNKNVDGTFGVNLLANVEGASDYNILSNKPILNIVGTLDNVAIMDEFDNGIYAVTGQYKISNYDTTTYSTSNKNLFHVEHNEDGSIVISKLTAQSIYFYQVSNGLVTTYELITEKYLENLDLATKTYVDEKIAAYVKNEIDTTVSSMIDEKTQGVTSDDIYSLFS